MQSWQIYCMEDTRKCILLSKWCEKHSIVQTCNRQTDITSTIQAESRWASRLLHVNGNSGYFKTLVCIAWNGKESARFQTETELFHRESSHFVSHFCSEAEHVVHSSAGLALPNLYSHVPVCMYCNDFLDLTAIERTRPCLWNSQKKNPWFYDSIAT